MSQLDPASKTAMGYYRCQPALSRPSLDRFSRRCNDRFTKKKDKINNSQPSTGKGTRAPATASQTGRARTQWSENFLLLLEHEGKAVFRRHGIPVPRGHVITGIDEVDGAVAQLTGPFVVKAQVLTGGRGKAGGIRTAADISVVKTESGRLLHSELKGQSVSAVLIEESVPFVRERYMSIMLDGETINLLLGSRGGVEVESYFSDARDSFQVVHIDPAYGLGAFQVRKAAEALGINRDYWGYYVDIAEKLYRLFRASDATLAEINPLVELEGQRVVALDARIVVDDGALYRQPGFADIERARTKGEGLLAQMKELEIQYVPIGGEVGLVSSGAGVGVTIMDWLEKEGARLSAFVDLDYAIMGGHAEAGIRLVLSTLNSDPCVRAIIVNFTTCGLRLDLIVKSLLAALPAPKLQVKPILFHLQGNRANLAHEMLRTAGWTVSETLGEAVREAAKLVKSI
jgi:succinyl-CoA synthetase beta subunit